ncbi:DUF397 domain-containing protein [Amycolatopsis sp. NPDC004368]
MEPEISGWRKSSYSSGGADNCVEVGFDARVTGVRDTKDRAAGNLTVAPVAWSAFLESVAKIEL